jgi:hypothetical protein
MKSNISNVYIEKITAKSTHNGDYTKYTLCIDEEVIYDATYEEICKLHEFLTHFVNEAKTGGQQ